MVILLYSTLTVEAPASSAQVRNLQVVKEVFGLLRQRPKAVDEFFLDLGKFFEVVGICQTAVEAYAQVFIGDVAFRDGGSQG